MKRLFLLFMLVVVILSTTFAQNSGKPDWRKLHYLSEEEMNMPVDRDLNFTETDPPINGGRMVAEFEPMQGVLIAYPFGIPLTVIAEMAEDLPVLTLVSSQSQANSVLSQYQANGVNTENCSFLVATTDSYWVRDYGPWYVFDGNKQPGIVDFPYDRPRPNDNLIPERMANHLDINLFGMNLEHTGGNMMVDGRGMAASTDLVWEENSNLTHAQIDQKVNDYLGVTRYDVTIDPLADYIKHIDCWGKYLAPDKILIAQVPTNDPRYDEYESVANYFATTPSAYGYPYKVYRCFEPGTYQVTPYTNSIILNNKVLVPVSGTQYDAAAIEVYEEAMPGYEIIPFQWNNWENTDALHCRSKGIADLGMLFIDHRPLYGMQEWQDSIAITSKVIAYSGEDFVADSLLVFYSINNGAYQTALMTETATDEYTAYIKGYNSFDSIEYYVFAKDVTGRRLTQPYMNELDPHKFYIEEGGIPANFLTISADTLWFENEFLSRELFITNNTENPVVISDIQEIVENPYLEVWVTNGTTSHYFEDPITLQPNEVLELNVNVLMYGAKNREDVYIESEINIVSNLGTQKVVAMINDNIYGWLEVAESWIPIVFENFDDVKELGLVNVNINRSVTITGFEEVGSNYLNITPPSQLPLVVDSYFQTVYFTISLNWPFEMKDRDSIQVPIVFHTDHGDCQAFVYIKEELLSISENNMGVVGDVYPNPFNDILYFDFNLNETQKVKVEMYNIQGQKVTELMNKDLASGQHHISFENTISTRGIYICQITVGNKKYFKKLIKK